jgi:CBS domain-containing protein
MALEKIVEDFMLPVERYGHVAEGDTLKTAVAELRRAEAEGRPPYLIVVGPREDGGDEVRGFISPPALVFGMAEHFLRGAVRTGPIFWEGQLRAECRVALQRKVAEVMTPFETGINHREMIMEAIFLMNKYQLFFLPVIRDEGVAGVIHLEDVMKEIIRIGDDETDRKIGDTQPNSSQEER